MSRLVTAALGAAALAIGGCDAGSCPTGDCTSSTASAFERRAEIAAPPSVEAGRPFRAVVTAWPRVSGVGTVRIVAAVGRLRALAPVADTLEPDLDDRATTRPARIVLAAGQPASVAWTLAVDRTEPFLNPGIGAVVALDSVRLADGRLVSVRSDQGLAALGAGPDGAATASYAGAQPVRLVAP